MLTILRRSFIDPNTQTEFLVRTLCSLVLSSSCSKSRTSDRVTSFLTSHGFSKTQISKITRVSPTLSLYDPHKTLAPKIQFLLSIGISKTYLPKLVTSNPALLKSSLENQLIPSHNFFKAFLIDDHNVVRMLMRNSRILLFDIDNRIVPNIDLLTEIGVPKSFIFFILFHSPDVACAKHTELQKNVEEAIRMGFDPKKTVFANALKVFCAMTKTTMARKWKVYKSWGFSDDEVGIAFRSHPFSMSLSEEKITQGLEILVNEMGREVAEIARSSHVLFYNLENRIKPRCRVIKVLISKGHLKTIALTTFLKMPETRFLGKFVSKYEDRVPELLNIYQEREII